VKPPPPNNVIYEQGNSAEKYSRGITNQLFIVIRKLTCNSRGDVESQCNENGEYTSRQLSPVLLSFPVEEHENFGRFCPF